MAFGGYLQANTAVDLMVGPFVDDTDGKTAETGLTITQAEVRLSKNAGNMAQKNEATSLTHDELGNYVCKLNTTDTNTEGVLTIMVHESGALPIKMDYMVLAQAAYISLVTAKDSGYMDVNTKTATSTALDLILKNSTFALAIADAIWDEAMSGHTTAGAFGTLGSLVVTQGAVETSGSNSSTQVQTDLAEATNDHYDVMTILFTSGAEAGQSRLITGYTGASGTVSWNAALTGTPADDVTFMIIAAGTTADAVWDEILTGASHNITNSAGKRLRQIEEAFVHASGVIATVTNGHTFTLDAGAVATADYYVGDRLQLIEGTGAGQSRLIVAYTSGKVVTLDSDFITNPDTSTLYEINAADVHVSLSDADQAQGFVATYTNTTTITLDAAAVATTDYYLGSLIVFTHGTGAGQVREITGYTNGRVITMSPALATALDTTTVWHVQAAVSAAVIVDEWEIQSQADPTGFHVNVKEVNGTAQTANDNAADINTLITQVGTAGDGLTAINLPNQTMDITGNITGNLSGSVGSLTGHTNQTADHTASITAIKAVTDDMKVLDTTIASVTTPDTVFTLTAGLTGNDDPNNAVCSIRDTTGGIWSGPRRVSDYVHASKTLTIDANTAFPLAAGDRVVIWNVSYATTAAAGAISAGDIADIVDGVHDETMSDHLTEGTTGAKLNAADRTGR